MRLLRCELCTAAGDTGETAAIFAYFVGGFFEGDFQVADAFLQAAVLIVFVGQGLAKRPNVASISMSA
jgi:hypothetical protein